MNYEEVIKNINELKTPENVRLLNLKRIPKSRLKYFVKAVNSLPTGDRNMRDYAIKPYYEIWERPVNANGEKNDFYGTKNRCIGSFYNKEYTEAIAWQRNFYFHVM